MSGWDRVRTSTRSNQDGNHNLSQRAPSRTVTLGRVQPQAPAFRTIYCNDRDANIAHRYKVKQDGFFPADLLLLASTNADGICYIETANLDGETNLKIRKGLERTWDYLTPEKACDFKGEVQCEQPNNSLYTFTGNLVMDNQTLPLSPNQLLLRVEYIFSDKTGTLTRNLMEFFKCSIGGETYGTGMTEIERGVAERKGIKVQEASMSTSSVKEKGFNFDDARLMRGAWRNEANPDACKEFFRCLAICHTVLPEGDESPEKIKYQAASPDEAALVLAAKNFGFFFYSTRKRQSVVCRYPGGRLVLYCKGADTVIFERLASGNDDLKKVTREHLEQYGSAGLRTLCLAYRDLAPDMYESWNEKFIQAKSSLRDREKKLDEVAELIEKDLILIGATAIEDKLQEGVPNCIETLSRAGIKIWVLTGDKMETAINIAYVVCCRVSPLQKAQVTSLVKKGARKITLSIGDGANDVSMIQAAHIGVGISGLEGMQAVMASDFAIAQFRFLKDLLLVHGPLPVIIVGLFDKENVYWVIYVLMSTFYFYITLLLVPVAALLGDFLYLGIQRWFFPYDFQIVQEIHKDEVEETGRSDLLEIGNQLTPDEARSYAISQLPRELSKHTGFAFDSPGYESFFAAQLGIHAPQKAWDVARRASMRSKPKTSKKH
ncbi:hypothetical protein COLO4_36244 [Corchorus olitorius]|uniref:P-type ATPase C-terminal domain-containing protein n=1 Tax=Corchorus olitorius TaxID=93759 RepID=A0A1R3GA87_9ROSI|nr:hypothetical protein COLO4_36244 [Corchorus olitorius]